MNRDEARAIEWDCAQILIRFFNEFDARHYGEMVALFAPDGVWHRQGRALRAPTPFWRFSSSARPPRPFATS